MLSRILGFVRDMIWAQAFGAGPAFDAFIIAFRLPNFMRRLFAEGAFAQAFVPVLAEKQTKTSLDDVKTFISHMSGVLTVALVITVIIFFFCAPLLISLFAPGFHWDGVRYELSTHMLRVTAPYLLFISLVALSGAVLNTYGNYGIPSFTPVLFNVCLILAAVYLGPHFAIPVEALAWGLLAAGIAQFFFQLPFLWQKRLLVMPNPRLHDPDVRRVLKLMVPALFGVSVAQLSVLIDTVFASFLPKGSVTWLYFSERLMNFPLGVFGVGIATVILPYLSRGAASQDQERYNQTFDWALRLLLLIGVPSSIGLLMLAGPMIATLFGHGKFTHHDVLMSTRSLMAFAVGVQAFMLVKVLASAFYARQNIKFPVKVAAFSMLCNMGLNFALIGPLAHAGLALATSISGFINAGCLLVFALKRGIYTPQAGWAKFFLQLFVANAIMIAALFFLTPAMSQWLVWHWPAQAEHLTECVFAALFIYGLALFLSGVRLRHFRV
ncbi:MAG: murein biosynthesis integral membrane protein MurJ [Gammaproteobacteria bacterium CG11_big_fil_rev_8_21_14_0_20_46_22]|nr:MAG: murein biosynthesis integral membrane protein MurJ [Gammaproteobacteria bacterium CG12_big_fil_rev_8_21_14_0_65_46_12]PIR10866.1 MAG: murein biosynthesis integral membrane protein MurJ [Gammaproteobacteria bacterium CG11_big_fil_rev_8_21_14_0_20_46_22]